MHDHFVFNLYAFTYLCFINKDKFIFMLDNDDVVFENIYKGKGETK